MKQLLQSLSNGSTDLVEIPAPNICKGHLLIRTTKSLISSGTEKMIVDFGKANLIDKAKQQPDKVSEVFEKAINDGPINTYEAIKSKLDKPIPLGYCNVGIVIEVGEGVKNFKKGERVVSNGPHAELVLVPENLCASIPDNVDDESACFTLLASIGLQGIRLANPTIGETFLVSGLGVIGLLTCQLLKANGCKVLAIDIDNKKCEMAESLGISSLNLSKGVDPINWCLEKNKGQNIDGVLITAATKKSDPVHLAAKVSRHRGRIVLVGVTGLDLRRDLFYKKELSLQVSCSYGPGRYDKNYEENGNDYPFGLVRWTEKRNFEAILNAISNNLLKVDQLISHRFSINHASRAYKLLTSGVNPFGIVLTYQDNVNYEKKELILNNKNYRKVNHKRVNPLVSVVGVGNFSSRVLIPAFIKAGANFHTISARTGIAPTFFGKKYNFLKASTSIDEVIEDNVTNTILIATNHDSHAKLIVQSLNAGKHVYVEKPLCLSMNELESIKLAYSSKNILMVGFNRRFAPFIIKLKEKLNYIKAPKSFIYTCNAGQIDEDSWIHDPRIGGGRLLGEACHFVDLLRYLADSPIKNLEINSMIDSKPCPDVFSISLQFNDGSIGTINYFSNGSRSFPKERLEVFSSGKVFQIDNYRKMKSWGMPGFKTQRSIYQDKGQVNCAKTFLAAISKEGSPPIPVDEIFEVQSWLLSALKK